MEKTFAMIKPSCVKCAEEVEIEMTLMGLRIVSSAEVQLTSEQAKLFYTEHQGKPFFQGLVDMLSLNTVKVYELEGISAVRKWRDLIGPNNPSLGERDQLRRRFADAEAYINGNPDNGFYGSASIEDAERELSLMKKWGYLK